MQLHLHGTLTEQDNHRHISHLFRVPEGAVKIDIEFEYAPKRAGQYGNLLTLSLFDPQRERGTGHRGQPNQQVSISPTAATPGYLPGVLPPGEWNVMVNTNLINAGSTVQYDMKISIMLGEAPAAAAVEWKPGSTNPRGPGWFRGDLHGHTIHSDGSWDVDGLVQFARDHQLDFVTLTDHNTVSALAAMDGYAADDLLTMGGFEFTTFYGHALALGVRDLIDWRVDSDQRTMTDIFREVEAAGGLFVIAHPMCPGDPVCTGCQWEYADIMPGPARVVEVWNEHWASGSNNPGSLQLWYDWLNKGHRLAATVGTDIHGPSDRDYGYNVVYAEALTEQAILDAVRRGHLYLSSGPQLALTGTSDAGESAMMGDSMHSEDCAIHLEWSNCRSGDVIRLIVDGEVHEADEAASGGERSWALTGKHWCLVEVRDQTGSLRAVTNPIFTGSR
jgi:hypothetical protein